MPTPRSLRRVSRRSSLWAAPVLALAVLSACGGADGGPDEPSAVEVLEQAKASFDAAESVRLRLSTSAVPESGNGVLGASGVLTQQPAFEGEVRVILNNFTADVPLVAVDQQVFAQLSFLGPGWNELDPEEYGAPDPSTFADPQQGLSTLLTDIEQPEAGERTRDGEAILTTYSGTLPGESVQRIIPSADPEATYPTTVGVTADGLPATVSITGPFFGDGDEVTYDVRFADFDEAVTVEAPST